MNVMKIVRFLIIISALFLYPLLGFMAAPSIRFQTLSTSNGLSSNAVLAIEKDSAGFIWIGTKKGLIRFDGVETVEYTLPDLSGNVWSIEESDKDTLLLGTLSDVLFFSRKSTTYVPLGLPAAVVKCICLISPGKFWAGTENGMYLVDNHKYRRMHISAGLSAANHITGVLRQDKYVYWFSTADGLLRIDVRDMKPVLYRNPDDDNFFTCLTSDDNSIFLGTFNKGIFRFNLRSRAFDKVKGFDHKLVTAIDRQDKKLYVGTNGTGLKTLDLASGVIETVTMEESGQHHSGSNTITCILNSDGIKWIGTQFRGVSYTPRGEFKFRYFKVPAFNSSEHHVRSMMTFQNGDKLIGTREGLYHIDQKNNSVKTFKASDPNSGLRSDIVVSMDMVQGKALISTYGGGVHVFDPVSGTLSRFSNAEVFTYGCVFGVTEDSKGNIWLSTQNGLYEFSPEAKFRREYNMMNSVLNTNVVFCSHPDQKGRLWIGTNFGLYLLDIESGRMKSDCFSEPIKWEIRYILEDSKGDIWVCTAQNGLYRIGMDLVVKNHYTTDDIMPENEVESVAEDCNGTIWICTRTRITRLNPEDNSFYVYKRLDGLNDLDFNNEVEIIGDSVISWANEGGLVTMALSQPSSGTGTSGVPRITSVAVGDSVYNPLFLERGQEIPVPHSTRSLRFRFSNMDFTLPYATVYEYRLEGYEKDWKTITGINEVTYENLEAGNYTFCVRLPGQETYASVPVRVSRPYGHIIGLVIGVSVLLMLTAYFCHRIWRLKVKIRNERDLFSKASENIAEGNGSVSVSVEQSPLMDRLLEYMDSEKPYRNARLSISDVAQHLGCEEKDLSHLLNSNMKMNFSNFINIYRVNEVKGMMTEDNLTRFTLMTIAGRSGFSSKTTFYRVFKDVTGLTPLQYCQQRNLSGIGNPKVPDSGDFSG